MNNKIDRIIKIVLIAAIFSLGFYMSFLWGKKSVSIARNVNEKLLGNVIRGKLSISETVENREAYDKKINELIKTLGVQSVLVFDMETGKSIISVDESKVWPFASLSKMMSLTVAIENINLGTKISISKAALEAEGESGGFSVGEKYNLSDIAKAMILVSSNDAAVALSESLLDGRFIELMNKTAQRTGMSESYFFDPTGLSAKNRGTANDMKKLLSYVWKNYRGLLETAKMQSGAITDIESKSERILPNINVLSTRSDFLGGKTGFTDEAKQNLAAVFSINGREIGIIILGAQDRVIETEKIIKFIKNDNNSSN